MSHKKTVRKKIAIVSNTSWSLYNFRLSLMKYLRENGYEVIAIAPYDEYSNKLANEGFIYWNIEMNNKGTNPIEDIRTIFAFKRLYKQIEPDVVLNYTIKPNIYSTIAASMLEITTINNIAGLGTLFIKQSFITSIAKWLYKYSQQKAHTVFFQNKEDYQLFIDEGLVESGKCDILPGSGVDTEKFKPVPNEQKETIRFLHISRMIWEKGVGEYVEAARKIKSKYTNVEFDLLGFLDVDNPGAISKEQMEQWVAEGIVNYLGVSDDVREIIAQADCVVLPSYYREGTPRTLLESASMAKPIITTDNVGCRDVVDEGVNGYLCKPRDSRDLASAMEKFLQMDYEERIKMGVKSREKMLDEYDEKIVINAYLKVIKNIMS
jgi:glycosyltransferase involved in cell wall biosynthesis